jgi:hypothetical protein
MEEILETYGGVLSVLGALRAGLSPRLHVNCT